METQARSGGFQLLQSIGPGIVFALTVLGPGDFVSNTVTGATHGYTLLWALVVALFFRYVWLDASARYVMATGESLMEGYARFGGWLTIALLSSMVIIRTLSNLYKLVLLVDTAELLLPQHSATGRLLFGGLVSAAAFVLCDRGGYRALERIFKVLVAVMCAALVTGAVMARPEPWQILGGLLSPTLPADSGLYRTAFILMALIGTEAGSVTNITYSYFLRRKGWRDLSFRRDQRRDLLFSVCSLFLISSCVQIAAAGTLLPAGVSPKNADDLVVMFSHSLGYAGRVIFTFGLCAAAFSGFVGGTTGYSLIAADVLGRLTGSDPPSAERNPIYRGAVAFWCFAPLALMAVSRRPVWLVLFVSALMAVFIPVLGLFLLRLTSNREIMGKVVNSRLTNGAFCVLIAVSLMLLGVNAFEWWEGRQG